MKFGDRYTLWLGAFLIFLIDQASKIWALNFLEFDEEFVMNKIISLHRVYNESYIMLNYDVSSPANLALTPLQFKLCYSAVALILTIGIFWVTSQPALKENSWPAEFSKTGLFLLFGGILGNLFDRIFRKEGVVDFIRINYSKESIPIVNVADVVIYLGELCLIIAWLIVLFNSLNAIFYKIKYKS